MKESHKVIRIRRPAPGEVRIVVKKCPQCSGKVYPKMTKCPHCGAQIS